MSAAKEMTLNAWHAEFLKFSIRGYVVSDRYDNREQYYSFDTEGRYSHEGMVLEAIRLFAIRWKMPVICSYGGFEDDKDIVIKVDAEGNVMTAVLWETQNNRLK